METLRFAFFFYFEILKSSVIFRSKIISLSMFMLFNLKYFFNRLFSTLSTYEDYLSIINTYIRKKFSA
ncbi:hypothetical protein D0809_23740 [Flavobacterium circumlabens]|uniref:Uncharacterized protein n=1 Tax=Flavobacterium circumlabens TaxID=2133765 RepID=A0A4Y7U5P7_9FLAO|nr:hypothetical protein D0809_23740 [Flavobacterium circumlabens]